MSKSAKDLQHDRFKAIDINSDDWYLVIQQEEYDPNIKYLIPNDETKAIIAIDEHAELAMNTHFDRIGSMMFVRTRFVQADGSIEEDNDCED